LSEKKFFFLSGLLDRARNPQFLTPPPPRMALYHVGLQDTPSDNSGPCYEPRVWRGVFT